MGYWIIGTLEYWDLNLDSIIPSFRYSKPCYCTARRSKTTKHISVLQQPAVKHAVDSQNLQVVIGIDVVKRRESIARRNL